MSNKFSTKNNKNITIALDKAEPNAVYKIISCSLPAKLKNRFAELGFVEGAEVTVTKKAPLGDPLEVKILSYSLCARANELKRFTVERIVND